MSDHAEQMRPGPSPANVRRTARHGPAFASALIGTAAVLFCISGTPALAGGLSWGPTEPAQPPAFQSEVVQTIGRFMAPGRIELVGGRLYVSDTQRGHVAVFDTDGVRTGTITGVKAPLGLAVEVTLTELPSTVATPGRGKGKAFGFARNRQPGEPVTQERMRIFVGDRDSGSVVIFEDGKVTGYLGSGDGEFLMPNAIAVNAGRIYVVDSKAQQVRYYDATGQFVGAFGTQGSAADQFDFPSDIVIDPVTGEVFVSDWGNRRVSVWDRNGNWIRTIPVPPNDGGDAIFLRPAGLGMDGAGNLYVVDNILSCVVVMSQFGVLVDSFGYQFGRYHTGELQIPLDAASDGNRVYVTSTADGRVKVFEMSP